MLRGLPTGRNNLQAYLNDHGKITRPGASPGIWMSFLLPAAVILSAAATQKVSQSYQLAAILCAGFAGSSLVFVSQVHRNQKFNKLLVIPMTCVGCLLSMFNGKGIIISVVGALISSFVFEEALLGILETSPKTLTYGEANVVVQAVLLFIYTSVLHIFDTRTGLTNGSIQISTVILQVGVLGIFFICASVYLFSSLRKTVQFYTLVAVTAFGGVVPVLHVLLQCSPILWIIELITSEIPRIFLLVYWIVCSTFAILAVAYQIQKGNQASTSVRKYFHILAVAVYIPGIIRECTLLYLASGVVLALFIILEMMRVLHIYPLADALQEGFSVFADEKDAGALALTPIYLLVGCSLPLWIHPSSCLDCSSPGENTLMLLSGILSVGIGDTAASVFGSWMGKHKWEGTKKSLEGTAASILMQMTSISLLMYFGYVKCTAVILTRTIAAIVFTSVIEAKTDQVDNLALPLVMYILLLSTE